MGTLNMRKAYGEDTLEENLRFVADALGGKGTSREAIRKYFLNDFYKDHYIETPLADGKIRYKVEGVRHWEASEGTDLKAVLDKFVSVGIATNIS